MESSVKLPTGDNVDEKLFEEQEKCMKDKNVEIKYHAEGQNGDSKIDCDMRRAFVGMGKEELMKFANDPFWIKMRWLLFTLFWILWIAMLTGAVSIAVYAPKCSTSFQAPSDRAVIYKLDLHAFRNSSHKNRIGYLKVLKDNLGYFENLGVEYILVNSLMEGIHNDPHTIQDFKKIGSEYGSFEILSDVSEEMKNRGMNLLMSFVPNYSSDTHIWFRNSIAKLKPFDEYYLWSPGIYSFDDGKLRPPNNWLSVYNDSAWNWIDERKEYYLHQFHPYQPDLNFRQSFLVDYFKEVFSLWLEKGIKGFHLDKIEYLVEDKDLKNEDINRMSRTTHDDYNFFTHIHSSNQPETKDVVQSWTTVVHDNNGILSVSDMDIHEEVNFLVQSTFHVNDEINCTKFHQYVKRNLAFPTPTWEWKCQSQCPHEYAAKGLLSIMILLPGRVIINGGEELFWPKDTKRPLTSEINEAANPDFVYFLQTLQNEVTDKSSYRIFKSVIELRSLDSVKEGDTYTEVVNSTIFSFTRQAKGHPGIFVAMNFGPEAKSMNLERVKIPSESVVESILNFSSPETNANFNDVKVAVSNNILDLAGYTFTVMKYTVVDETVKE